MAWQPSRTGASKMTFRNRNSSSEASLAGRNERQSGSGSGSRKRTSPEYRLHSLPSDFDDRSNAPQDIDSGEEAEGSDSADDVSPFSTLSRPPGRLHNNRDISTRRRRRRSLSIDSVLIQPGRKVSEPLRTKFVRLLCWQLLLSILVCFPFLAVAVFIPLVNIVAIPIFCILFAVLFFNVAFIAYLVMAQTDPPEDVLLPFLPWDLKLVWRVDVVVFRWIAIALRLVPAILGDWCVRKVLSASDKDSSWGRHNIHYGSARPGKRLDVYRAAKLSPDDPDAAYPQLDLLKQQQLEAISRLRTRTHHSLNPSWSSDSPIAIPSENTSTLSPVVIFIHSPHLGPIRGHKWMYESLGRNLAALGYAVVIPDLTSYPEGRAKEMVQDVRRVMSWTRENIRKYGGDADRIYLMGHSLGAHLALLTTLQEAVVTSRENLLAQDGDTIEMSNGLRKLQIYSPEVRVPKIQGLILLAPICDVNDQIVREAHRGVSHISTLRRILGPTHTTAMFHSPAHVLHASRNVVNVSVLPPKILFIHGGVDEEVHHTQSEMMKEMLRGVGLGDVRCRIFPVGHVDVVTSMMMKMNDICSPYVLDELTSFVPL